MITLVSILFAIVLFVLALLFRPYFWKSKAEIVSRTQLNTTIYRDELAKLDHQLKQKLIAKDVYDQEFAELRNRLSQDVAGSEKSLYTHSPRMTIITLSVLIPVAAISLYLMLSRPLEAVDPQAHAQIAQKEVEQMVAGLAAKLQQEPDNQKGWAMLAKSYKVLDRPIDAQQAYERAGNFIDSDAQMLADYADVLATNSNGSFAGKPEELLAKALKVDPNHPMALWLAGTAAYNSSDFSLAITLWEKLSAILVPDSEDARMIQGALRDARGQLPQAGAASTKLNAAGTTSSDIVDSTKGVGGIVEVDAALASKFKLDDVVMVIARATDVKMPVAVLRVKASELPVKFNLTDALAMTPQARISSLQSVLIEARVSKSGFAIPEPGDLYSDVQTVKVGDQNIRLFVNQVRR